MFRIFISYYLFIVVALIGLSALLDTLLLDKEPENDYLNLLAHSVSVLSELQSHDDSTTAQAATTQTALQALNKHPALQASLINASDLVFSPSQTTQLHRDGYLLTFGEQGQSYVYSPIKSGQLLQLQILLDSPSSELFLWYRLAFFAALALLVALWSWPLWRDIKKLEHSARSVRPDGSIQATPLGASSSLNVIADALANLSHQVRSLLNNQRELTSAVAHEFRTPLARIKFALASMQGSATKHSMEEDVVELEQLIQEMLEFSQSEHHQPELSIAEIPIAALADDLINRLPSSKTEAIDIVNHCQDHILQADGHFVQRALINLLNNASKYAHQRIEISSRATVNSIAILVDDDGPGIPEALRDKIFDPFYRPDKSRARHKGGAGLGLATVKRIQHWHQGECWVEDSPLGGARFVLQFPANVAPNL